MENPNVTNDRKSTKSKACFQCVGRYRCPNKKHLLNKIAEALDANKADIFAANREDIARSQKEGIAAPLIKRLKFDEKKLTSVIEGINALIALPDPLNEVQVDRELAPGLELTRVSCPIGVLGIIFESRPDALVQISTLCLKSGNCTLLKGGSEASLPTKYYLTPSMKHR